MGGGAFAQAAAAGQPTLNTPRMTPAEYTLLRDVYLDKIRTHISGPDAKVAVLREAPEKTSYGDIDIFIGLDEELNILDLANAIGARAFITRGTGKYTLAVLKDGSPSTGPVIEYTSVTTTKSPHCTDEQTPEEYAQIDLGVIPTDQVAWHIFYSSYGDLNSILGHIVTHLGFTVTDLGLWLRMKELDEAKKIERAGVKDDQGRIFLSGDPYQVMGFLGLSTATWDAGFTTLNDLYAWLEESRMIHAVALKLWRDKANDRRREETRPVYRNFFFEWLPERVPSMTEPCEPEHQKTEVARLRQHYLDDALDFFNKRSIYEEKLQTIKLIMHNAIASNLLRPMVIEHSKASPKKVPELMRAFRRFVRVDEDGKPYLASTPLDDSESQLHRFLDGKTGELKDRESAERFVSSHWEEAKELERGRQKAAGRAVDA